MSDYTVKREKEGILRIQAEGTKMPSSLTINERDYADDKQLIVGGESSSPVKVAHITIDEELLSEIADLRYTRYIPGPGDMPDIPGVTMIETFDDFDPTDEVIVPMAIQLGNEEPPEGTFVLTGDVEIINMSNVFSLYITGDCSIEMNRTSNPDDPGSQI